MLPLDVANNEGYAGTCCSIYTVECFFAAAEPPPTHPHPHYIGCEVYDTKLCGGLNMNLMWTIVFWMIPAWVFI